MKRPPFAHTDAASEHQAHVEREESEANARVFRERREQETDEAEFYEWAAGMCAPDYPEPECHQ